MMAARPTAGVTHSKTPPVLKIALGIFVMLVWAVAVLFQIETSEAALLKQPITRFIAILTILHQPVDMVQGNLHTHQAMATIFGWGIEIIFMVLAIGYETAHEGVKYANPGLARWFASGMVAIVVINAVMDFFYSGLPSGILGQLGFSLILSFLVLFAGTAGVSLIAHGVREF